MRLAGLGRRQGVVALMSALSAGANHAAAATGFVRV